MDLLAAPILEKTQLVARPAKKLGIVWVGDNPSSEIYINLKQQKAAGYGINTRLAHIPETSTQAEIIKTVRDLNQNPTVDGIIVQLPLPDVTLTDTVLDAIEFNKDVDNLTGSDKFLSPMVQAVKALADYYKIDFTNKKVCVVGQGRLVGQPIVRWLELVDIQPSILPSPELFNDTIVRSADIVIAGTGARHIINATNTRPGQIIFDCSGIDVDYDAIKDTVAAITPPKGGVGPLTVHFLLSNVIATTR
jgi:methylenetetrahydrofolate dehydrogenase (NADP+)/methenyltetrahydrofolate cyclohydrolase